MTCSDTPAFKEVKEYPRQAARRSSRIEAYDSLKFERPESFVNPPGAPIEILFDAQTQTNIADDAVRDYSARGIPVDFADIGVVYRDPFMLVVRDAVRFRSGATGPYVRVFNASTSPGCAVLPITESSEVIVLSHFRHETRRWHWEIPRGFGEAGESPEQTAARELGEELGVTMTRLVSLGALQMDGVEPDLLFLAHVTGELTIDREEGIDEVRLLPLTEFIAAVGDGSIDDPYCLAAISRCWARKLLPLI